jgi:thiol-disulfide isomerase/thioredoxin
MRRIRRTAFMAVLLALSVTLSLGALTGCSDDGPSTMSAEDLGFQEIQVRAPDFTLETLDGGQMTLSSFQGTPVLMNFWALNCPPCREEMPFLDAAAAQYEGQIVIMAIDIGDSQQSVADYFSDATLTMMVPLDTEAIAAANYSVGYTPTTFLVDTEGVVRYVKVGPFANVEQVSAAIELILQGA